MRAIILFIFLSISSLSLYAQPVSQLEQIEGLTPYIQGYGTSESFIGSDTAWINDNQRLQYFDDNNKLIEFKQRNWENEHWIYNSRNTHEYNLDSLLFEIVNYSWNGSNWFENSKLNYLYNQDKQVLNQITFIKESDEWIVSSEETNIYDEDGYLTEKVTMTHFGMRPDTIRSIFTYDEDHNLLERLIQNYNDGDWQNKEAYLFNYANGLMVLSEDIYWYADVEYKDKKDSVLYDENGRAIELIRSKYYDEYQFDSRYTMQYDENGNQIELISENWLGNKWGLYTKYNNFYDSLDRPIEKFRLKYRNNQWEVELTTRLKYNEESKLTEYSNYLWFIDDWRRNAKTTYDYTAASVRRNKIDINNCMNYPNPLSYETTLQIDLKSPSDAEITILNYSGQIIKTIQLGFLTNGLNKIKLDLSDLSNGNYIYIISTSSSITNGNLSIIK